jgi:hypothetical protein
MNKHFIFPFLALFFMQVGQSKEQHISTLCPGDKISAMNYLYQYPKIEDRFKDYQNQTNVDALTLWKRFLSSEEDLSSGGADCLWNQFLVTDFIFYFEQTESLLGKVNKGDFLKFRDDLYFRWIKQVNEDISLAPPQKTSIKSKPNSFLGQITSYLNKRPEGKGALREVYDLLEAKSIFESIFSGFIKNMILDEALLVDVRCILNTIKSSSGQNLWSEFQLCSHSKERLITILGALSSQRMYLLRDYKVHFYNSLSQKEYNLVSKILDTTSLIYFELETYATVFGHTLVYPQEFSSQVKSSKPYHFYSVAFIAQELKKRGYTQHEIKKASIAYARQYKKNIRRVGVVYNLLLGQGLTKGTVRDYEWVIKEQDLGSQFGQQKRF